MGKRGAREMVWAATPGATLRADDGVAWERV